MSKVKSFRFSNFLYKINLAKITLIIASDKYGVAYLELMSASSNWVRMIDIDRGTLCAEEDIRRITDSGRDDCKMKTAVAN